MTKAIRQIVMLGGLVACATFAQGTYASVIDPREIQLAVGSSLTDLDSTILSLYFKPAVGDKLSYVSQINRLGWTGHLFGNYGANAIDVEYAGTMTPLDLVGENYRFDYTSRWNINGIAANGSGWGTSIDPLGTATIIFNDTQVGGSISYNAGLASITIAAKKDNTKKLFTASGTIGIITIPIADVSLADGRLGFAYLQSTGNYASVFRASYLFGLFEGGSRIVNEGVIKPPVMPPAEETSGFVVPDECVDGVWCNPALNVEVLPGLSTGQTEVASVPEPATWAMTILGFMVIGGVQRSRRLAVGGAPGAATGALARVCA